VNTINFIDPDGRPYDYTMADFAKIDFGAAGEKEILQNVYRLILTPKYSVPLDRLMGFESNVVDTPISETPEILIAEVLDVVHHYEPRVEILDVSFSGDPENAKLVPTLKLGIRNVIYGTRIPYSSQPSYQYE
jgi:phage baseplate assembly protein W